MKKSKLFTALLAAAMVVGQAPREASSTPGGSAEFPSADRGMMIFEAYCVGCHGLNGKGDGPMSAALQRDFGVSPADLSGSGPIAKHRTDEQLKNAVQGGGKAVHRTAFMPAWGATLNDAQVGDLVAYLRELQSGSAPEQPSFAEVGEQLELGRVLYGIHCAACHGTYGEGDGPFVKGLTTGEAGVKGLSVPKFTSPDFFRNRTDADIEKVIATGVTHSGLKPASDASWWDKQMRPTEIQSLILYMRSLPVTRRPVKS